MPSPWPPAAATAEVAPALGYGEEGQGSVIPPNTGLIFDIELVEVR